MNNKNSFHGVFHEFDTIWSQELVSIDYILKLYHKSSIIVLQMYANIFFLVKNQVWIKIC